MPRDINTTHITGHPGVSSTGLVLAYNMETLTGGLMNDFSGGNHDGTITGAADATGYAGRSRSFDGEGNEIIVADESAFDFGRTDAFSISMWVFPEGTPPGDEKLIAKQQGSGNFSGWNMNRLAADDTVRFGLQGIGDALNIDTQVALVRDVWTHVLFTYDGSNGASGIAIYFNGVSQTLDTVSDNLNNSILNNVPVAVGALDAATQKYQGRLDEIMIWSRELTAAEALLLATDLTDTIKVGTVPIQRLLV